ncbi:hypothetical protein D3C81_1314300 [compost metagenome]
MLCPNTKAGALAPAAATSAITQSAMASTVASGVPWLRLWPGRSTASTEKPWLANQRVCSAHTLWSFCAPWTNTAQGRAGSKGLPPV